MFKGLLTVNGNLHARNDHEGQHQRDHSCENRRNKMSE